MPDHTTLSRRGRAFAGRQPRTAQHDGPVHVVLDSTGLQMFGQASGTQRSTAARPGGGASCVWPSIGEILAHVLTDPDVGDITAVPSLLATVAGPIASVIADGAYDGASVYRAASLRQRDPLAIVIPPRAFSVVNDNKAAAWTVRDRHVQYIAEKGRMAWQKATGYGRRSLVETAIGRYKHGIGPTLQARSADGQRGEVAIAVSALNRMIQTAKPISVRAF